MAIVPQLTSATADPVGDAVFMFPDVPQGELWSGTTTIPGAPAAALSIVTTGGQLVGSMQGPGSYGPWTVDHSRRLAISTSGLVPDAQYVAVWHADSKGAEFSTYPAPITTAVSGTVNIPQPVEVDVLGSVLVDQGSPPWETQSVLAPVVSAGQLVMAGAALQLPAHAASEGVVLSAPTANTHPIALGPAGVTMTTGLLLEPGQLSPLLPVQNSSVLYADGNAPDVLSFLVT